MNTHSTERFHDALEKQYRDLIQEAILECESNFKTQLNLGKLNSKLQLIMKAAQYDGLSETTISHLIDEAMPNTHQIAA